MTAPSRAGSYLASLAVLAGTVLVLNLSLSLYVWVPRGQPALALVPLVETLALVWLIVAAARLARRTALRWIAVAALAAAYGVLLVFSVGESFFRVYFARPFYPRSDIPLVRGGLLLLLGDIGPVVDVLTPITITLIFAAGIGLGLGLVSGATRLIRRTRLPVAALAALSVLSVPLVLATGLPPSLTALTVSWLGPGGAEFVEVALPEAPSTASPYALPGLLDRDVYLFAVEAYGYTTVSREDLSRELDPSREAFRAALERAGYQVLTSYLRSPVAGGYSWLAEATLLTGQWVDTQEKYLALYGAGLPTLSGMLHDAGYYTLTVRPGTVHGAYPEGWDLYRFQDTITAFDGDFGFVGPWFSYVPVTDQYALWIGERRVRELTTPGGPAEDTPLLVHYQLVSSHTPYTRIPPIIEDWETLGNGDIYNQRAAEIQYFDNTWTGGTQLEEGYVAALQYVFRVLADYVDRIMDHTRSPILIVFGDHQPQPPIRSPGAVFSVPIHVATRDPSVAALFAAEGYQYGMVSSQPPPHASMDTFFPLLARLVRQGAR